MIIHSKPYAFLTTKYKTKYSNYSMKRETLTLLEATSGMEDRKVEGEKVTVWRKRPSVRTLESSLFIS